MKKINTVLINSFLFMFLLLLTGSINNAQPLSASAGLVGWWAGEGDASDSFGSHDGSISGTTFVAGQDGQALHFDGNDFVVVPHSQDLSLNAVTISVWVKFDQLSGSSPFDYPTFVSKGGNDGLGWDWAVYLAGSGGYNKFRFAYRASNGGTPYMDAPMTPVVGTWYHIVVTHDGSTMKMFVNDNLEVSATGQPALSPSTQPVYFGRENRTNCCWFRGSLDDIQIYNRALADNEISQLGTPSTGTLQTLTILGGNGNQGAIDAYTEASRDGGATWQPAYLTGWHPWGFADGTDSWINFDPSPFVGLNSTTDYRIRFNIPADFSSPHMTFLIKADNRAWLSVNGTFISQFDGQSSGAAGDQVIAQALVPGLNEITIRLQDFGGWVGLNYRIDITMFSNEEPSLEPSDFVNAAPVANAGADQTFDCIPLAGTSVTLNGSGSSDPDGDALSFNWSNGATTVAQTLTLVPGTHTFTLTVNDGKGGTSSDNVTITVNADVTPPVPDAEALAVVTGECGAVVTEIPTATDECGGSITGITSDPLEYTAQGTFTITWSFSDVNGNSVEQTQTVVVKDVTAPSIESSKQFLSLWSPNHKYEKVSLSDFGVTVTDNCADISAASVLITKVTSDEVEDSKGNGDGNTKNDIVIADDFHSVDLRKEREGTGNGRVYTIYASVSDGNGNVGSTTFKVQVPHDVKDIAFDDGAVYEVLGATVAPAAALNIFATSGQGALSDMNASLQKTSDNQALPEGFELSQNYPNPFNPTTTIQFATPESGYFTLKVYNTLGQEVADLFSGQLAGGTYKFNFNASNLSSGIYLYSIRGNNLNISRKMNLMK